MFKSPEEFWAILNTGNYGLVVLACGNDMRGALSDATCCLTWETICKAAKKAKNTEIIKFLQQNQPEINMETYKLRRDRFKDIREVPKTITEREEKYLELVRRLMLEGKKI